MSEDKRILSVETNVLKNTHKIVRFVNTVKSLVGGQ